MVDNAGDTVTEDPNNGTDTVLSSISYTLGANVENLTGSSSDDRLTGDDNANVLTGGDGNDTLIGAYGADTLSGGAGTDTADYSAAQGAVTVRLDGNASTGDVAEGDVLRGIEQVIGGGYADTLIGDSAANSLIGGAGDDTLRGAAGADSLVGGDGRGRHGRRRYL